RLLAAVARQLASNERVMLGEQLAPRAVAELGGAYGRADDVGEEEGREHRVRHCRGRLSGDEALDLVADLRRLEDEAEVIPGDTDRACTLDPGCHLRSEEHTSELQSLRHLVCRLLLE